MITLIRDLLAELNIHCANEGVLAHTHTDNLSVNQIFATHAPIMCCSHLVMKSILFVTPNLPKHNQKCIKGVFRPEWSIWAGNKNA